MNRQNFNKLEVRLNKTIDCETVIICCKQENLGDFSKKYNLEVTDINNGFTIKNKKVLFIKSDDLDPFNLGAKIANNLQIYKLSEVAIVCDLSDLDIFKVIEACALRYPEFIKYKTSSIPQNAIATFIMQDIENEALESSLDVYDSILEARSMVNTAPNHMRPSDVAKIGQQIQGVKCNVLQGVDIKRMECLEAVGRGSTDKSKLITLEFMNNPDSKDVIALVGKGVTFDTGGYSLKPANAMQQMHSDMAGASVVIGIMSAIAKLNRKVNVVGVIPCAENMISGDSMRPEDIYTSYSGQTVQVLNTDAEGRLILADAISYAQEIFAPKVLIDFATLTGAIVVALGSVFAGAYSNDDELFETVNKAGQKTGERVWRMPLAKEYSEMMDSKVADIKNISESSEGGSATAAAFLGRFIKQDVKWLHLDIAGTSYAQKATTFSTFGATGFGIRLILDALASL